MANNITVKDASSNNIQIHTIEDSTSAHYNMSIPITVSGVPIFTTAAPGVVSLADSIVGVSISPTQANIPVSVNGLLAATQSGTWTVQPGNTANTTPWLVSVNGIPKVSVADSTLAVTQSGTWNTNASVVGRVSVFVDQVPFNVSINNTLPVPVSVVGGRVSIQGAVSIAPQTLLVHVCNSQPAAGGTQLVSIGGAVSTQAVQIAGTDGTNARTPLTNTTGNFLVHVCNALPTVNGITQLVSVGGAVSTQAVQIAGRDTNGDARSPLMTTTGIQFVNVCNAIDMTLADNAPVSVRGGRVSIADSTLAVTQSGTWNVGINAGTNLIGAVSVRQIVSVQSDGTANWPVSIAGTPTVTINDNAPVSVRGGRVSIADGTLAVTQSGTWTVQPGNTVNTTPWLVSVGGNVSITDNAPVSVRGGVLGAVSLGGGTAQVGRVSVFVDQVPFNVSINNSLPVPVSIVGGRVSVQGISQVSVAGAVTVSPLTNTGAAVPNGAFFVGGTDGTNLRALLVDALGALKVTGFVTNAESSFTLPASGTAQYASGDLVANSATAGTVTPLSFALSRYSTGGGSIMIRRARIVKSDGDLTTANFRLHLYNTSNGITNQGVSVANGDNGVYQATKVSTYLGFISVACQVSHSDGAVGWGGPNEGMEINVVLPANQFTIQGLLEARGTYTPSNSERFNVTLEAYQD